ncbi:hypothetical protein [Rosenbergiella australiborealis]|nr:hypothetical protein [Rosenbergiella australiborealis]
MWKVEQDEDTGSYVAAWGDSWLPNTYQSEEEAMAALLDEAWEWMS